MFDSRVFGGTNENYEYGTNFDFTGPITQSCSLVWKCVHNLALTRIARNAHSCNQLSNSRYSIVVRRLLNFKLEV